jgi:hypothetical protein
MPVFSTIILPFEHMKNPHREHGGKQQVFENLKETDMPNRVIENNWGQVSQERDRYRRAH